jgi:hypothetical protein
VQQNLPNLRRLSARILVASHRAQSSSASRFTAGASGFLKFVEQGEKFKKLYPHGITKIHLSVKAYGVDFSVEIDGPDHA